MRRRTRIPRTLRTFSGARYDFVQSRCANELLIHLHDPLPVVAILLDLDFRRTDLSLLIDGEGNPLANSTSEERKRLVANQGIAILSCVRRRFAQTPVLLFADLAEAQRTFLTQRFAPLTVVSSHVSMRELQVELDELAVRSSTV